VSWKEAFKELNRIEAEYGHSIQIIFQKWHCGQDFIMARYWVEDETKKTWSNWHKQPRIVINLKEGEQLKAFGKVLKWLKSQLLQAETEALEKQ